MEFRLAVSNDAESIAVLHARSWQRAYRGMMPGEFLDGAVVPNRLAAWQERMHENRADRFTCVALDQGQVAGFICAFGDENKSWGSYIDCLLER